ncbi:hypothetical protein M8494_12090 [Serratia ureilytica]
MEEPQQLDERLRHIPDGLLLLNGASSPGSAAGSRARRCCRRVSRSRSIATNRSYRALSTPISTIRKPK